jgi:branched-chain amino acid transport system substrate-binding protein
MVRGRWQARIGGLAALALVAACTPAQRVAAPPPPPTAVAAPAVERPAAPVATLQNKVALLAPLTGPNALVGQSIANAASLAMLDIGAARVALRVYDTAGGAEAAANSALADGAGLILGPLLAGDVRAVAAVAAAANVPVLSFSNDAALAGGAVFVLGFQPGQSIARVVGYARGRGLERFAALVPAGVYGQRAQGAFVRAVEAAGGRTTAVVPYTREPTRMLAAARAVTGYDARARAGGRPVIRPDGTVAAGTARLAPLPFQGLMVADSGAVAAQFAPALQRFGAAPGTMILLGTELWNTEAGLSRAQALRGGLFAAVPDERFGRLAVRYREKYGAAPSRLASLGYDAILLVNSVAGNWALGARFPKAALYAREGFAGIDGAFRFTPGNVAERALEVQQIGSGAITTVSPAPKSFGG